MELPRRVPKPASDLKALERYAKICARRGYCGPFLNQEFYMAYPDPMWHGYGECAVCCSTRLVSAEEAKRRALTQAEDSLEQPLEDPISDP